MRQVQIGARRLAVHQVGDRGPILLMVHGFPLDHSMWQFQIAEFADRCRVLAVDLRGFGASESRDETVSMEQYADDLAALLDELGIAEPVNYLGLSMGGYVAWQFWKRHRQRLERLILCDTRARADNDEVAPRPPSHRRPTTSWLRGRRWWPTRCCPDCWLPTRP
ncbi:MAG: alpha/beta hydrolase [Pirellulaceae bacterium]